MSRFIFRANQIRKPIKYYYSSNSNKIFFWLIMFLICQALNCPLLNKQNIFKDIEFISIDKKKPRYFMYIHLFMYKITKLFKVYKS